MLLSTRDLSVSFVSGKNRTPVTHGVSLEIDECEVVALVGESGSGKSVTAMEIAGLNPRNTRSTGEISFLGRDLTKLTAAQRREMLRNDLGIIFQDPLSSLNPVYTVGTSMGMSMKYRVQSKAARRARSVELLERVGIPDPEASVDRYPHELSGGQRQRVMIAMAIDAEPKLLIADEPTTALDVTVQADVLDLIEDLKDKLNMSVLLITHDMGVVANTADRMYVMKEGKVVENGNVHPLFTAPAEEYTRTLFAAVPRMDLDRLGRQGFVSSESDEDRRTGTHTGATAGRPKVVGSPALSFRDVDYYYSAQLRAQGKKALSSINFEIAPGRTMGLVGESGSGKSTIGRLAVGLLHASGGIIEYGSPKSSGEYLRSMVFQDPSSSLDPRRTIGESVAAPLVWQGLVPNMKVGLEKARGLLDQVHLPGWWSERHPHELSGGQRQRVGIARALSIDPDLLVADEPTSALDVSVQAAVLDLFAELQDEYRFACLFISHDLAVVESVADEVVVLRQGKMEESGTADSIIYSPTSPYTQRLIASVPVPDPAVQHERKRNRRTHGEVA